MSQTNDFASLNSIYKESYADKIKYIIPDGVKLYEMIDFISAEKRTGEIYVQPVSLTLEHGKQ